MMMRRMRRKWRCLWASIGLTGQNISPIGRFFLTLYKQSCGSLSMLTLDHMTLVYFSLRDLNADRHTVLYHHSSGQICHAPGQDLSHSDNDITLYMQQGLLRPMVYSSEEVLPSVCPFASVQTCFCPDWFCPSHPPWTKHALGYCPWIS